MRRTLRLLKQLNEAQKYILRNDVNSKRLALILLDNFVEVQLFALVNNKFSWDNELYFFYRRMNIEYPHKYYSKAEQDNALKYHDSLIKVALNEGIIDESDYNGISFTHEIRNKAYHTFEEEETLTKVGLYILYNVICKRQICWGVGKGYTEHMANDPLENEYSYFKLEPKLLFNWEQYWPVFYQDFFRVEALETFDASLAISKFIIGIINETNESICIIKNYLSGEFDFNKLLCDFYFQEIQNSAYEDVSVTQEERNKIIFSLRTDYIKKFRKRSFKSLDVLAKRANELSSLKIDDVVLKYHKLVEDVEYFHRAFIGIHSDIETHIQNEIDRMRGK